LGFSGPTGGAWGEGFGALQDETVEGSGDAGWFGTGECGYGEHTRQLETANAGDAERAKCKLIADCPAGDEAHA